MAIFSHCSTLRGDRCPWHLANLKQYGRHLWSNLIYAEIEYLQEYKPGDKQLKYSEVNYFKEDF